MICEYVYVWCVCVGGGGLYLYNAFPEFSKIEPTRLTSIIFLF